MLLRPVLKCSRLVEALIFLVPLLQTIFSSCVHLSADTAADSDFSYILACPSHCVNGLLRWLTCSLVCHVLEGGLHCRNCREKTRLDHLETTGFKISGSHCSGRDETLRISEAMRI
eukprot:m.277619 g.277619  ORF g.277619 m.277619 type:complete len:116 (+) comp19783_c0_seq4:835-1182(+)